MKVNVGATDRTIRIMLGVVLLSLVFVVDSDARWWGLLGLMPLVTGLVGRCPLYLPFGIDSSQAGHRTSTHRVA